MDRHKYTDKCLALLSRKQFTTLTNDPTKTLESKVQRTLRKIKSKFTEQEYKKLYPTGSCPGNLTKLLAPLRESEYIIKSTKDFIGKVKSKEVAIGYQMVLFDIKSLFTNVPIDRTIDIVLRRI